MFDEDLTGKCIYRTVGLHVGLDIAAYKKYKTNFRLSVKRKKQAVKTQMLYSR